MYNDYGQHNYSQGQADYVTGSFPSPNKAHRQLDSPSKLDLKGQKKPSAAKISSQQAAFQKQESLYRSPGKGQQQPTPQQPQTEETVMKRMIQGQVFSAQKFKDAFQTNGSKPVQPVSQASQKDQQKGEKSSSSMGHMNSRNIVKSQVNRSTKLPESHMSSFGGGHKQVNSMASIEHTSKKGSLVNQISSQQVQARQAANFNAYNEPPEVVGMPQAKFVSQKTSIASPLQAGPAFPNQLIIHTTQSDPTDPKQFSELKRRGNQLNPIGQEPRYQVDALANNRLANLNRPSGVDQDPSQHTGGLNSDIRSSNRRKLRPKGSTNQIGYVDMAQSKTPDKIASQQRKSLNNLDDIVSAKGHHRYNESASSNISNSKSAQNLRNSKNSQFLHVHKSTDHLNGFLRKNTGIYDNELVGAQGERNINNLSNMTSQSYQNIPTYNNKNSFYQRFMLNNRQAKTGTGFEGRGGNFFGQRFTTLNEDTQNSGGFSNQQEGGGHPYSRDNTGYFNDPYQPQANPLKGQLHQGNSRHTNSHGLISTGPKHKIKLNGNQFQITPVKVNNDDEPRTASALLKKPSPYDPPENSYHQKSAANFTQQSNKSLSRSQRGGQMKERRGTETGPPNNIISRQFNFDKNPEYPMISQETSFVGSRENSKEILKRSSKNKLPKIGQHGPRKSGSINVKKGDKVTQSLQFPLRQSVKVKDSVSQHPTNNSYLDMNIMGNYNNTLNNEQLSQSMDPEVKRVAAPIYQNKKIQKIKRSQIRQPTEDQSEDIESIGRNLIYGKRIDDNGSEIATPWNQVQFTDTGVKQKLNKSQNVHNSVSASKGASNLVSQTPEKFHSNKLHSGKSQIKMSRMSTKKSQLNDGAHSMNQPTTNSRFDPSQNIYLTHKQSAQGSYIPSQEGTKRGGGEQYQSFSQSLSTGGTGGIIKNEQITQNFYNQNFLIMQNPSNSGLGQGLFPTPSIGQFQQQPGGGMFMEQQQQPHPDRRHNSMVPESDSGGRRNIYQNLQREIYQNSGLKPGSGHMGHMQ